MAFIVSHCFPRIPSLYNHDIPNTLLLTVIYSPLLHVRLINNQFVEEARRVRRLGEVFVLERSAQGGGESDLSCLVKREILYSVLRCEELW